MSRATVRTAVAAYLDTPAVTGLRKVHKAKPLRFDTAEVRFDGDQRSSAHGYVHIESVAERRAATGKRYLDYTVGLVCHWRTRHTGPTGGQDRMDDLDALVEAIKARLRTKPVLGGTADAAIFDAAESLLQDTTDIPQDEAVGQSCWFVVRFNVDEMITA